MNCYPRHVKHLITDSLRRSANNSAELDLVSSYAIVSISRTVIIVETGGTNSGRGGTTWGSSAFRPKQQVAQPCKSARWAPTVFLVPLGKPHLDMVFRVGVFTDDIIEHEGRAGSSFPLPRTAASHAIASIRSST